MEMFGDDNATIVHAIQLAIAPAFLLTGMAGLLSVLNTRMGRIIDRYRILESGKMKENANMFMNSINQEMQLLDRRAKIIHQSIALCTASVVLINLVVVFLFFGSLFHINLATLISLCFIFSSLSLLVSTIMFLNEVRIAARSMYGVAIDHPV